MKDKILFWCDRKFTTFGIAHSLQQQYDCDLFAIIQLPDKTKDVFREQQLVRFKQVWVFNDHVSKEKQSYDLKYLASFEKKYKINLWKIPLTDAYLGHNNYHKFTRDEILSLFTQECKLFEEVLDKVKPNFLIMRSYDNQDTRILYEICKSRGIKVIMLVVTRFDLRYKISDEEDDMEDYTKHNFNSETRNTTLPDPKLLSDSSSVRYKKLINWREGRRWLDFRNSTSSLLFANSDEYLFLNHGKTIRKGVFNFFSSPLKKKTQKFFYQ